jgi:UDP-glucose 4-epimerase
LIDCGYNVVVYDDLSHGHAAALPAEAKFVRSDIAGRSAL